MLRAILRGTAIGGVLVGFIAAFELVGSPAQSEVVLGSSPIAGPLRLMDRNGRPVIEAATNGKPTLLYFVFTHCPDDCPTTLSRMSMWLHAFGSDADRLSPTFVSIDRDRVTPSRLRMSRVLLNSEFRRSFV